MPQDRIRFTKRAHKGRSFRSGSLFKHTENKPGGFERPVQLRHKAGGGYQVYHPPLQAPKIKEIIAALRATRSASVTLGVLGTLSETPEDYDPNEYPPFERLYLARIKQTRSTLVYLEAVQTQYGGDEYQLLLAISDLTGFDWATLDTVYIAERS